MIFLFVFRISYFVQGDLGFAFRISYFVQGDLGFALGDWSTTSGPIGPPCHHGPTSGDPDCSVKARHPGPPLVDPVGRHVTMGPQARHPGPPLVGPVG